MNEEQQAKKKKLNTSSFFRWFKIDNYFAETASTFTLVNPAIIERPIFFAVERVKSPTLPFSAILGCILSLTRTTTDFPLRKLVTFTSVFNLKLLLAAVRL